MNGVQFTARAIFHTKVAHSGEQMITGDVAVSHLSTKPGAPVGLYSLQLINAGTTETVEVMLDARTLGQLGAWIKAQAGGAQ